MTERHPWTMRFLETVGEAAQLRATLLRAATPRPGLFRAARRASAELIGEGPEPAGGLAAAVPDLLLEMLTLLVDQLAGVVFAFGATTSACYVA